MTSRISFSASFIIALLAWAGLLLFTRYVPPHSIPAFVAFFVLVTVALASIFTPVAYLIGRRFSPVRVYRASTPHALRQGVLLSLVVVLNLILRALHSWNIFMALIILAAAVVLEILFLARK